MVSSSSNYQVALAQSLISTISCLEARSRSLAFPWRTRQEEFVIPEALAVVPPVLFNCCLGCVKSLARPSLPDSKHYKLENEPTKTTKPTVLERGVPVRATATPKKSPAKKKQKSNDGEPVTPGRTIEEFVEVADTEIVDESAK